MKIKSHQEKLDGLGRFWKAHIDQWADSSLSQKEYCRQKGISPNRFTYWKLKFKNCNQAVELVQVQAPVNCYPCGLKLNVGPGLQIEIPDGFSQNTLERVLICLKAVS